MVGRKVAIVGAHCIGKTALIHPLLLSPGEQKKCLLCAVWNQIVLTLPYPLEYGLENLIWGNTPV
ncbi:MAG: hypothetical protein KJ600_00480 [Nanoarchaeota archaeon]|nr:hypothetical protein [Nanoarchaeota archaeon]